MKLKEMKKISICICTHNNEKEIARALESALQQGENASVIVVDDGSDDGTGLICDSFAEKNDCVKVIHTEWKGVVHGRDICVTHSDTEYITFLDADDWLEPGMSEYAVDQLEMDVETDILVFAMVRNVNNGEESYIIPPMPEARQERREALNTLFTWDYYRWELCGKVYRKRLFDNICVDETVTVCEDLDWNWLLFQKARYVRYSPKYKYHYFVNNKSVTNRATIQTYCPVDVFARVVDSGVVLSKDATNALYNRFLECLRDDLRERSFSYNEEMNIYIERDRKHVESLLKKEWNVLKKNQTAFDYLKEYTSRDALQWKWYQGWERMIDTIAEELSIYIYGTGRIAAFFLELMNRKKRKVSGIVVTKLGGADYFGGFPVEEAAGVINDQNSFFVLAMSENNQRDVLKALGNIKNLICLDVKGLFN